MEKLLSTYSVSEILMFIVILALAVKAVVTFWDWAVDRLRKVFAKEHQAMDEKEEIEERLNRGSDRMKTLEDNQNALFDSLSDITEKINMLIDSDKDDIKSWLTKEHHYYCYQQKWIDDYSLECCEKRFKHYTDEGGNSFIERFMEELRGLPKQPPLDK